MPPSREVYGFDLVSTCNLGLGGRNLYVFLGYRVLLDARVGLFLCDFAWRMHLSVSLKCSLGVLRPTLVGCIDHLVYAV